MEQVYTPNVLVPAVAGWCLAYVDDAGNAPNRTATARYAFQVEQRAGRIRSDTIPENVWLVGWLDFTAGMYTTYGHVFLFKRNGNSYQIYDSEVQSGARRPYGSIQELLAWFGAYKPVYTGWSTHCDGREYARIKEDIVKPTRNQVIDTFNIYLLKPPVDEKQINYYLGQDIRTLYGDVLGATKADAKEVDKVFTTYLPGTTDKNRIPYYTSKISKQLYMDVLGAVNDKLKKAEKELAERPSGEFVKVSDLYIKKEK